MSGIIKSVIQSLSLFSLVFIGTFDLTASTVNKSSKTKLVQSTNTEQVSTKSSASSNNLSVMAAQRKSSYVDVSEPGRMLNKTTSQKAAGTVDKHKKQRDPDLSAQLKSSSFYFSSVEVLFHRDLDYDGYYSEFTVNFDADTDYNSATVYALLYLSYEGGPWELYYETDYFNINGWSSSDDLSVTTLLTEGYPPGRYDILIDLYDEYDHSLVATISSDDTSALADLYLEDTRYEADSGGYEQFSIYDASVTLLDDNDNDGFYHSFSLQFDADVSFGDALVYAEIWVKDSSGDWTLDHSTSDYLIEGNSTLDTYIMETVWESGYSTGYYDFRVELYDAMTSVLLATSEALDHQLFSVPLEDTTFDMQPSGGSSTGGVSTSVSYQSGGGGSMELVVLMMLLILGLNRHKTFDLLKGYFFNKL